MFLSKVREKYEQRSIWFGKYCSKLTGNPDIFSIFGTCCGIIAGLLLWKTYFISAVVFMLLSGLADMADGAVARFLNKQHPFGTVFDRVNDRYVEFFVVLGCVGSGRVHPAWAVFSLFGALMTSYTRACAESAGKVKNCAVGLMERQEKAVLLMIGILLEPLLNPHGLVAKSLNPFAYDGGESILILQLLIIIIGFLSHFTVYQRLMYAKKHENEI
jgi:archaetidylinositol phosphate synthase